MNAGEALTADMNVLARHENADRQHDRLLDEPDWKRPPSGLDPIIAAVLAGEQTLGVAAR